MDLRGIFESLGQEHVPGEEMTAGFLEDAVAGFAVNPTAATSAIRQLQASNPPGFVLAAVRLLISTEEKSPGLQYVAGLMFAGNLLVDALLDHGMLVERSAVALARNLAMVEPLLDVRLFQKMLANAAGDFLAVKEETVLRVLTLVEAISDCSRLSTYLVRMLNHPSSSVRCRVVILLGRSNLNLNRIKNFMSSADPHLRASAVESLWGRQDRQILGILTEASKDPHGKVAINALVGLCRTGDQDACDRLARMAGSPDPSVRANVAWAMGEAGGAGSTPVLTKLEEDADEEVRAMAARSLRKLNLL
jgi:hypothetical protein